MDERGHAEYMESMEAIEEEDENGIISANLHQRGAGIADTAPTTGQIPSKINTSAIQKSIPKTAGVTKGDGKETTQSMTEGMQTGHSRAPSKSRAISG